MGKIKADVFQCDCCGAKSLDDDSVFDLHGEISDGDCGMILSDTMLCPSCMLQKLFVDRDILDPVIDASELIQDEIAIKEEQEEDVVGESKLIGSDYFDEDEKNEECW